MDILGKNWQIINILFCGIVAINDDLTSTMCAETYTRLGTVSPKQFLNEFKKRDSGNPA